MKGMEMMLGSMLGIKPEQMQATIQGMISAAETATATAKRIEDKLDAVLALHGQGQERLENGNGNGNG